MSNWTEGYVNGIDYTYEYYRELNPSASRLPLLRAGYASGGRPTGASCELGFGFGVSTNIHAAASAGDWWGTDFNPTQAGFAQELGQHSGASLHLFDQSFAEFCSRTDLPEFDFIGLHGIWSWVSDENRRLIVDFVRRRLRVGGVMYISYNSQPGWAQMVSVRQLLTEHTQRMSPSGGDVATRIGSAVDFVNSMLETSPGYAAFHPSAAARIKSLKDSNKNYLAHEYFNRDWQPMMFSDVAAWFEPAKVSFACSALHSDHFNIFNLSAAQVEFLNQIKDPIFFQIVRDFMTNRQFRKDYWIKGPSRLGPLEQMSGLRAHRVILVRHPAGIVLRASGALVDRDLPEAIYQPLIEALADRQIHTLAELEGPLQKAGVSFDQLVEAVMVLIGKGDLESVQGDQAIEQAFPIAKELNRHLVERSAIASQVRVLASPVTGGGFSVQPFHLQMLQARQQGLDTPKKWAAFIQKDLEAKGAGIVKPAGGMMSVAESLDALTKEGKSFAADVLPQLRAHRIVE